MMDASNIVVTGGAGFIGSHIVDALLCAGHRVSVIDDLSTGFRRNLNPGASFYQLDIRSPEIERAFEKDKPATVIHLAAHLDVRRSLEDPIFDADTNILGSLNLLECCVRHGVEKFVFASTGGAIYGEPENLPVSEDQPPEPMCHYGLSKLTVEHYIRLYHLLYDLRYTILRFPNVYGPRQNSHGEAGVCSILIRLMLNGEAPVLYGHGAPVRDYVFVEDIARGTILALERGDGQTLNLGSSRGTSVLELFEMIKGLVGLDKNPKLEPLRPGEVDRIFITGDRAEIELGWKPKVNLPEGLARTVEGIKRDRAPTDQE